MLFQVNHFLLSNPQSHLLNMVKQAPLVFLQIDDATVSLVDHLFYNNEVSVARLAY